MIHCSDGDIEHPGRPGYTVTIALPVEVVRACLIGPWLARAKAVWNIRPLHRSKLFPPGPKTPPKTDRKIKVNNNDEPLSTHGKRLRKIGQRLRGETILAILTEHPQSIDALDRITRHTTEAKQLEELTAIAMAGSARAKDPRMPRVLLAGSHGPSRHTIALSESLEGSGGALR